MFSALSEEEINQYISRQNFLLSQQCEDGMFKKLLVLISFLQIGFLLSSSLVATFIYKPYCKYLKSQVIEEEEYKYEELYLLDDYQDLIKEDVSNLKNTYLIENTPEGQVTMCYDNDEEGFLYWSSKIISFKYLETVARRYVIQNKCVNIYQGYEYINDEIESETESEDDKEKVEEKESVFMKKKNTNETNRVAKIFIRNKFKYKGKMSEMSILKNEVKKKEFSFSDYKKMNAMNVLYSC